MFAINILSAINALNISTMHPTTVAEFHIENGVIQPYLSSIREHNFSVFGITRSLYENYVSTILSLYFDSIQLSNNLSAEDFKTSRDLFYSDLKLLVHSILDETFKITEISHLFLLEMNLSLSALQSYLYLLKSDPSCTALFQNHL